VVVYAVLKRAPPARLFIFGDSRTTSSLDVERDPVALRAATTGRIQRDTVQRGGQELAEVAIPLQQATTVILISDSLDDPLSSLHVIERQLLVAGLIGLLFAVIVGYVAASFHARRIGRLERAAERIAGGRFDEPVVDAGNDELGDLAAAFELHALAGSLLHELARALDGLRRRDLVAHEREIADEMRPREAARDGPAVVGHLVERHRDGGR
jgi:HAMP domain-containing protein